MVEIEVETTIVVLNMQDKGMDRLTHSNDTDWDSMYHDGLFDEI